MSARLQQEPSLYRGLLGARFDVLPARVRELHDVTETAVWVGRADVERGRAWFARMVAALLSLPPDGRDQRLQVSFEPDAGREVWTRAFGAHQFRSVQFRSDGLLGERIGAVSAVSALDASDEGLTLHLRKVLVLGIALPRGLHPSMRTFESQRDGRYRFEVEVHLPVGGLLVRYAGWLERAGSPSA
jgi:Domain of unknown function (DUF4166)